MTDTARRSQGSTWRRFLSAIWVGVQVFDQVGARITKGTVTKGRVYAPAVVGDLDGDGTTEIIVGGNQGSITAYEYKNRALTVKSGWATASTCSAGQCPQTRGLAAADVNKDYEATDKGG